ncbi:MAG: hypothetical protein IJX78_00540, partial [Bacilli bacterium]|nr:hypothetical protein [Bacilli bacterium]
MRRTRFLFYRSLFAFVTLICISFTMFGVINVEASDDVVDFVSFGASNVNGFGLRGYYGEDWRHEAPWLKGESNFYGYKRLIEGSYPDLLADMIEEAGYNVERHQMGVSGTRVEELRFFLDESYKGDAYTDIYLFELPGYDDYESMNYMLNAGKLEWEKKGFVGTPTNEQIIKLMRETYRETVKKADFITLDVGANNFGTYMANIFKDPYFGNDFNNIDPAIADKYEACRSFLLNLAKSYMGGELPTEETLLSLIDTMAYALIGCCVNFDAVIEKIRELNPDVPIVVVSIQNIMVELELKISDTLIFPFGKFFGDVVDAANAYISGGSKHCLEYYYADVRETGHVEYFYDDLVNYNGDPATISKNMKDCFDIYDETYYIETRVQQYFAGIMMSDPNSNFVIDPKYLDGNEPIQTFMQGLANKEIGFDLNKDGKVDLDLLAFVEKGVNGTLKDIEGYGSALEQTYAMYDQILTVAYDVVCEFFSELMSVTTFDLASLSGDMVVGWMTTLTELFNDLYGAMYSSLLDPTYSFSLDEVYPDGLIDKIVEIAKQTDPNVTKEIIYMMICMGFRTDIGNGFLQHPNENGHVQIKDAIVKAVEEKITGPMALSTALEKRFGEYGDDAEYLAQLMSWFIHRFNATDEGEHFNVTDTTKYLALGDSLVTGKGVTKPATQSYPALLASALGVNNSEQYTNLGIDGIRANELHYILNPEAVVDTYYTDKISEYVENAGGLEALREKVIPAVEEADIITLQVGANNYSNFVVDQLMAYIQGNEMYEMDWDKFFAYELSDLVLQLKEQYSDEFYQKSNIPEENRVMMEKLMDLFIYSTLEYTYHLEAIMTEIKGYNPDAFIVILGTYNPLKGVYYEAEGSERMELGEMLDEVIDLIDNYLIRVAADYDNCVYVDISETTLLVDQYSIISKNFAETTKVAGYDVPLPKFLSYTMTNSFRMLHPNANGNEYIKNQIIDTISH